MIRSNIFHNKHAHFGENQYNDVNEFGSITLCVKRTKKNLYVHNKAFPIHYIRAQHCQTIHHNKGPQTYCRVLFPLTSPWHNTFTKPNTRLSMKVKLLVINIITDSLVTPFTYSFLVPHKLTALIHFNNSCWRTFVKSWIGKVDNRG